MLIGKYGDSFNRAELGDFRAEPRKGVSHRIRGFSQHHSLVHFIPFSLSFFPPVFFLLFVSALINVTSRAPKEPYASYRGVEIEWKIRVCNDVTHHRDVDDDERRY